MKLAKLSLAAVVALSSFSYADLTDLKLGGNAKLWYETADDDAGFNPGAATGDGMFGQGNSGGQAVLNVTASANAANGVQLGLRSTTVTTLGLENNVVSNIRMGHDAAAVNGESALDTQNWFSEAYAVIPLPAKTILKVGTQTLDTPLAYSENWNITDNTFDAAVAVNQAIKGVTLIAAYVGKGNGQQAASSYGSVSYDGEMSEYGTTSAYVHALGGAANVTGSGAYAFAALAEVGPAKVNAWYYNVQNIADAIWLDASMAMGPANVKAIYASVMPKGQIGTLDDTSAFALSAGAKVAGIDLSAAYSAVGDDKGLPIANTATGFKKTKLPTATIYGDGKVSAMPGATSFKLKAATKMAGISLAAQYGDYSQDLSNAYSKGDSSEFDLIVGASLGAIDAKLIYMNFDHKGESESHIRAILSTKF